jgi:uncharacterized membrane protein
MLLFLGRFHPLLVHLPIGFLVLLVALESMARIRRFRGANACAGYMLAMLVPAALASAACGWLLAGSGGYDGTVLGVHRWLGIATVSLCALVALVHERQWTRSYAVLLYLSALVLAVTSHFGGSLTHGSDYLTRYAPARLHARLDRPGAAAHPETSHPGVGVFAAVVQPILQARCAGCHNPEKRKGGLSMDTLEGLMHGGEHGPALVAGNAIQSPMLKRMLLPPENEDHMPPDGKPQPKPDEIAILRWWVEVGAPFGAAVNDLNPPPDLQRAIEVLGKESE